MFWPYVRYWGAQPPAFVCGVCCLLLALCPALSDAANALGGMSDAIKPSHACILRYVKPAKSGVAATHLQQACHFLFPPDPPPLQTQQGAHRTAIHDFQPTNDPFLVPFYRCLLESLPPVHNDQSATAMHQLCKAQYHPTSDASPPDTRRHPILQFLGIGTQKPPQESPRMGINGTTFVPLVPWQGGQQP